MDGAGSGGGKVFGRFSEPAHRVLDLAREEADRFGHRHLGPEHVLLGVVAERQSPAARVLRAYGVELMTGRAALARLADRGVVPAPRPSDAELLGVLDDARRPAESTRGSRRHRQIITHVGLPEGYRGAAGPLLDALGVDLDQLREVLVVDLGVGR